MNVLLPQAPSGTKGVPDAGEGPHGRHDKLDGNFAAALAETAGENGDETVRDENETEKSDDAGAHFRAGRRIGARHAHEARERVSGETPMPRADMADESAELQTKEVRRADHRARAKGVGAKEVQDTGETPKASPAADPAQGTAAAREVLAVLTVDLTARPERAAAPELAVAAARKGVGPRGADLSTLDADRTGTAEVGDEVDAEEAFVLPVRVVRQEKHFQAAGVEARRWQIAQDAFEAGRAMPTAEMSKPEPGDALQRARPAAPAAFARVADATAPVTGPALPGAAIDVAPGAVGLQIADRVQEALTAPADSTASSAPLWGPALEPDTRQTFAPALRVIKLHLNPAELGAVTIVLSGNDQGLHIELAAELADTANKVESDRGVLAARLSGAGYSVTDINVARMAGQGTDGDARDQAARHGGQQEQLPGNGARDGGARHGGAQQAEQHADRRSGTAFARADSGGSLSQGAAPAPVVQGVSYAGRFRPV